MKRTSLFSALSLFVVMSLLAILTEGCEHKDIIPASNSARVEVKFDWSKTSRADASAMALYLYPKESEVQRHWFSNSTGGFIKILATDYTAVCHNNDNTFDLLVRNHHTHEDLEIYTDNAGTLAGQGISTRSIPRAPGTEDEPLRNTPPVCYGSHVRDIRILGWLDDQVITLYPEELVSHYTVEFVDVENLDKADLRIDGTISGLAGGYYPGRLSSTDDAVTHTFTLSAGKELISLKSEFLTFGIPSGTPRRHIVCVYIVMRNRTGNLYTFDVTDQVNDAPDPQNVYIKIHGLKLPEIPDDPPDPPGDEGGGMEVTVDQWNTEFVDLPM